MPTKSNFSIADLEKMGLEKQSDGSYAKVKPSADKIKSNVKSWWNKELVTKEVVNPSENFQWEFKDSWFIQGYNVPSKKNSRQNFVSKTTHKMISLPSKKHAEYVKATAMQYKTFGREFKAAVKALALEYPLSIEFTFIRGSKHKFDYCNACQTCEDIMKGDWIPDDDADYIIPVFTPYKYDKQNPGVIIKLLNRR